MRGLARAILRPIVGVWAGSVARTTALLPYPSDAGPVHAPGIDSDRVLLFGSGPAMSWGVLRQDLGLAGAIARALAAGTGRGVDVVTVARPDMTLSMAVERVDDLRLERFDAVVATLGVNDAVDLVSLRVWGQLVSDFVRATLAGLPADSVLFMTAIPPIKSLGVFPGPLGAAVAAHARAMNSITEQICAQFEDAEFVVMPPLPHEPKRYRGVAGYEVWGGGVATAMVPRMLERPSTRAVSALDDAAAAEWLARIEAADGRSLRAILQAVAGIAGTRYAVLSIAVGDRVYGVTVFGVSKIVTAYEGSLTQTAILSLDGIRVPDTALDDRFAASPLVVDGHARFFAGFPIRSPEGSRIGALSVFDTVPDFDGAFETGHLRDFAQRVQAELLRLRPPRE